jgi:membrane dipeptidase
MNFTRRSLLETAGLAALAGCAPRSDQPASADGYENAIVIDGLGGFTNPNRPGSQSIAERFDARARADLRASGVTAMNVTLNWVAGPGDPYTASRASIAEYDSVVNASPDALLKVLTTEDILAAKSSGRTGLIYGFQNAEQLGGDTDRVSEFFERGIRIIQLTYNIANSLGHGSVVPENGGLTDFGREAVAAMNETGMLVDLSHSGEQTCLDALAQTTAPIVISHTGCRALSDLPRNKTDTELRGVAECGGVVGIYYMPFLNEVGQPYAEAVVRHIEHALNVCGEDHVGIGTDNPVSAIDDLDAYRLELMEELRERRRLGISAPGETDDIVPFIPDLRGPDKFSDVAQRLSARGHSERVVNKILGANFLRVMNDVWPG